MTVPAEALPNPNNYPPDYRQYLADLLDEFPNAKLDIVTQVFLLDGFDEMQQRNGDRPYHDGLHPFDVLKKSFRDYEEKGRIIGFTPTQDDYTVLAISSIYHDNILVSDEEGISPELLSAEKTYNLMKNMGIYSEEVCERVFNQIWATEAQYIGKEVLQPMATGLLKDPTTPSLLDADIGDVLHLDMSYVLRSAAKLAAEELYKIKHGITILKEDESPLTKVKGIFEKQDIFGKQRFKDYPKILRYHFGDELADIYIDAKKDTLARQWDLFVEYVNKLEKIKPALFEASRTIIDKTSDAYHDMGDEFFATAKNRIDKLENKEPE
jgi:hypothetical protein